MPESVDGRTRLILAAEALLATRGLNGVSDREILAAAGHRNNSAIRYHFGSRGELVDAIWNLHSLPINLHRNEMLARLPDDGSVTTRQLVEAFIQPLAAGLMAYMPSYWARFNEQYLIYLPTLFLPSLNRELDERDGDLPMRVVARLVQRMQDHLVWLTPDEAAERVALTIRWFVSALANWEREVDSGSAEREALPRLALTVTDLGIALLDAPPTRTP